MAKRLKFGPKLWTIVDDDRYEDLKLHTWHMHQRGRNIYACTQIKINNIWKHVMLHHFILPKWDGVDVDHKNNNGLDNRRKNLQYLKHADNVLKGFQNKITIKVIKKGRN